MTMRLRWGVCGTGAVAAKFVLGLAASDTAEVTLVASRSRERAGVFAQALGIAQAVEGYEAALRSGSIDVIYLATPPSEHLNQAVAALEAGVPVLVEKPFATSAAEARAIADTARRCGVFCMEGMWTRFLPAAQRLRELVADGMLGEVRQVSGSLGFGYAGDSDSGNFDPVRGGGALRHLGVYPVSLAQWLFGSASDVSALGRMGRSGVDEEVSLSVRYSSGVLGSFQASLRSTGVNDFHVTGTHGSLALRGPIYRPYGISFKRSTPRGASGAPTGLGKKEQLRERTIVQRLAQFSGFVMPAPFQPRLYTGNGYHYEAEEIARVLSEGLTESPIMPLADSIAVAETLDLARQMMTIDGGAR